MKKIIFMTLFLLVAMTGQSKGKGEFTVLQWNVWQEGTMVPGGYDSALATRLCDIQRSA